jgi:hypothetical protein
MIANTFANPKGKVPICPKCHIYMIKESYYHCPNCGIVANPLRHTAKGWYWGSVGPQPTRDAMIKQVKAIFASGYKDNPKRGLGLLGLAIALPLIPPNPTDTKLYHSFHESDPKGIRKVYYEPPTGKLIKIGRLASIEYLPENPSKHTGTRFVHESGDLGHKTIKSNAILCTNADGSQLYIVKEHNTKYPKFTDRGIIG